MIFLKNDYSTGAMPEILKALTDTNSIACTGYGEDEYCEEAKQVIKDAIGYYDADIHFLMGGTQTNIVAMQAMLKRPYHCVIASSKAHINVHETGAIEAGGHKIYAIESLDGKITPEQIRRAYDFHENEHYVKPKAVYISEPTELGLLYSKKELEDIKSVCEEKNMYLYIDGARLAMGLASDVCDFSLMDLPYLCDAFYIGGTKCGLLFGEALVVVNDEIKEDLRYIIKQRGAMLAKGRLLGVMFGKAFKDKLYYECGRSSVMKMNMLSERIREKGYEFMVEPKANMAFVLVPNEKARELEQNAIFETEPYPSDEMTCIRLVTTWSTSIADIHEFVELL